MALAAAAGGLAARAEAQQPQRPSIAVASVLRAEPATRVPLPIQVGPAGALAKNSFIRIRGLPPAAALSEGYAIAAGTWAVPLVALPSLTIILPAGVEGESTVAISLVSVEGDLLAEAKMVIDVSRPSPAPLGQALPALRGIPPQAAAPPPLSAADRERALALHAKGVEQLERGNIFAARKFFERAVDIGLAQSAVALASTYDPDELAKLKVIGLQPDVAAARKWYEKARELGAVEAAERLARLGVR